MVEKHSFGATCGSTCIYNAEVIIWLNAVKGIGEFFEPCSMFVSQSEVEISKTGIDDLVAIC